MANLSKATPRPWKAEAPRFGSCAIRQDPENWNGMGYQLICSLPAEGKRGTHYREMFDANAALIVKAVNLHDELVAVLREIEQLGDVDMGVAQQLARETLRKVDASDA